MAELERPNPRKAPRSRSLLVRVVARNWRLKLSAFALTLVLWAVVHGGDASGRGNVFTLPVRPQVGDLSWTLVGEPTPATVRVRFRGTTDDLITLAREGATLRIPLDSVTVGDTLVQLRRDWVVLAAGSGLIVEDIVPGAVRVRLEPTLTAPLPIRVLTIGELPAGLALAAPVGLDPPTVRVHGAARSVRELDSISLVPLDLGGVDASGSFALDVDTAGLGDVTVTPASATLSIQLEPSLARELAAVRVVVGEPEGGRTGEPLVVVPATIPVRLTGGRSKVGGVDARAVAAFVPWEAVADLAPGQERRVAIQLRGVPALVRGAALVDSVLVRKGAPR